jgi:hypothetical protein
MAVSDDGEKLEQAKRRGKEILTKTWHDVVDLIRESDLRLPDVLKELRSTSAAVVGRAMEGTGSKGANLGIGLGTMAAGLAGLGFGGSTVARTVRDLYHEIQWKEGFKMLGSEELLERTFDWMNVADEDCKKRFVCEVEQFAAEGSTFWNVILRFLSKKHPSFNSYWDAVENGLDNRDCGEIYFRCPVSSPDMLAEVPLDRFGINTKLLRAIPWGLILPGPEANSLE